MTTNRRLVFPALIAAGILWGTTVPLSKLALGWLPPAWLAFGRFALAAAVLMAVSRSRLRTAFSPAIVISGGIGYGGSVLLQNLGIDRTSVTHAALLIGATPVLVAVGAAVLGHSVARPLAWAGFAVSLAGVAVIAGGQSGGSTLGGDGLVLASQLASAGFTVSQARLLRGRDPVAVTGLQLMAAAAAMLPIALVTEHHAAGQVNATALLAVIGLVLAGTVGPTALFAFGQSRVSADVAGAFLNIEPLVGAILGVLMFATPVGPGQIAGGSAIVAGIGLSSFRLRGRARSPQAGLSVAAGEQTPDDLRPARKLAQPESVLAAAMVPAAGPVVPAGTVQVVAMVPAAGTVQVAAGAAGPVAAAGTVAVAGTVAAAAAGQDGLTAAGESPSARQPVRALARGGRMVRGGRIARASRPSGRAAWRRPRRLRRLTAWASEPGPLRARRSAVGPRRDRSAVGPRRDRSAAGPRGDRPGARETDRRGRQSRGSRFTSARRQRGESALRPR